MLISTAYSQSGGIIGRGVLIDWYSWAQKNGIHRSPFQTGAVEYSHIKAIITENNLEFRSGDILFIRVGFTAQYNKLSAAEQEAFPDRQPGGLLGLEATRDSLRWLWESRFAAVASDAAGFERGPATGPYNDPDVSIHQWALAGWGMPMGELFDLEELAEKCAARKRWTFFLCSVPLKVSFLEATLKNSAGMLTGQRFREVWPVQGMRLQSCNHSTHMLSDMLCDHSCLVVRKLGLTRKDKSLFASAFVVENAGSVYHLFISEIVINMARRLQRRG